MAFKDFGLSYEEDIFSVIDRQYGCDEEDIFAIIDRQYGCSKGMASEEAINKTQNAMRKKKKQKTKNEINIKNRK